MAGTIGYRVGDTCQPSSTAAHDYILSQVVPVIKADGTLVHPVKQSDHWFYNGQQIILSLPPCDPLEDFNDGLAVGTQVILLMFIAFVIKLAVRVIWMANERREDEG